MNIALYQILVPCFCFVFILKAFSHYFRGEKTIRELISWVIVWGAIAGIAFFPNATSQIALFLGIKSNVNAILFTISGILLYLVFKLMIGLENTEQHITVLTRRLALRDIQEKEKQ